MRNFLLEVLRDLSDFDRAALRNELRLTLDGVEIEPATKEHRVRYRVDPNHRNHVPFPRGRRMDTQSELAIG